MGTITTTEFYSRIADLVQDPNNVRWPVAELLRWLNDGQRTIVIHVPSAYVQSSDVSLVEGSKQTLPNDGLLLLDIPKNTIGDKRAIRLIKRELLDAELPEWHNEDTTSEVLHYMYDHRNPKEFYIYPPNDGDGEVQIIYSAVPPTLTGTDAIGIDDIYIGALLDYILYRIYLKDSDYSLNTGRAEGAYQVFLHGIGVSDVKGKSENPNIITRQKIAQGAV